MYARYLVTALAAGLLVTSGVFVVDVDPGEGPSVVDFGDTIRMTDLTQAEQRVVRERSLAIPRAEVFYSRYRYVVGHEGLTSLVTELDRDGHERQFGIPLSIYVTDYTDAELATGEDGFLRVTGGDTDWIAAHCDKPERCCSSTSRTPRSRNSSE